MKKEQTVLLILLGFIFMYTLSKPCYETFTGRYSLIPTLVNDEEYIKDVKNIASYVGNYIGQIYVHLRTQQFDTVSKKASVPMWEPKSINDVKGVPRISKHQLDVYMTSATKWLDQKYPKSIKNASKWGIKHEMKDGNVYIYYKTDGFTRKYLV